MYVCFLVCVSHLRRSCSSSPPSCRWAAARCGPARRCWCTRPRPCAGSWSPRTWTGSPPRCTGHTCKGSACRRSRRSDILLPVSEKERVGPAVSACARRGGQTNHTLRVAEDATEGMTHRLCRWPFFYCCLYTLNPNKTWVGFLESGAPLKTWT